MKRFSLVLTLLLIFSVTLAQEVKIELKSGDEILTAITGYDDYHLFVLGDTISWDRISKIGIGKVNNYRIIYERLSNKTAIYQVEERVFIKDNPKSLKVASWLKLGYATNDVYPGGPYLGWNFILPSKNKRNFVLELTRSNFTSVSRNSEISMGITDYSIGYGYFGKEASLYLIHGFSFMDYTSYGINYYLYGIIKSYEEEEHKSYTGTTTEIRANFYGGKAGLELGFYSNKNSVQNQFGFRISIIVKIIGRK